MEAKKKKTLRQSSLHPRSFVMVVKHLITRLVGALNVSSDIDTLYLIFK